jgi:hypothetical protein
VAFKLVPEEIVPLRQHACVFFLHRKSCKANFVKKGVKLFIQSSPICLHDNNFPVKEFLNKGLKFMEFLKDFGLKLNEIDQCKFVVIINKTYAVLITTRRFRG